MTNKPELLSPAGDLECVATALRFGADAVYVGGPMLQLRAGKVAFTEEQLEQAVQLVHQAGKRIYVTVNSFMQNEEVPLLPHYAKMLEKMHIDAAIVSDLGALDVMKQAAPHLELHVSTQANCMNYAAANVYAKMGASRIVLARELSLADIAALRKNIPPELELEAFVHGAMCMSYSGRCMLSAYFNNRSGNRGECTQPCRWKYHISEMTRPNVYLPVEEDDKGTAIFSAQDLCAVDFLDELAAAGVCSFKIEGRMKTPFYVATVVNAYRRAIDKTAPLPLLQRELDTISHRPYASGFYFGEVKKHTAQTDDYIQNAQFIGVVQGWDKGVATVQQRNRFAVGDVLEVLSPAHLGKSFAVESMCNAQGEWVAAAPHPLEILTIPCPLPLAAGDILRRSIPTS